MTGVSIALLVIYGTDVVVGEVAGEGFLGSDHMARGIGLFVLEPSIEAQESGRSIIEMAAPLFAGGAFIVALGAIKLKKSKSSSN